MAKNAKRESEMKRDGSRGIVDKVSPATGAKEAAISPDDPGNRTLRELSADEFLRALEAGGTTIQDLVVWPEKKKVERLTEPSEDVARLPARDVIDFVRNEKKKRELETDPRFPDMGLSDELVDHLTSAIATGLERRESTTIDIPDETAVSNEREPVAPISNENGANARRGGASNLTTEYIAEAQTVIMRQLASVLLQDNRAFDNIVLYSVLERARQSLAGETPMDEALLILPVSVQLIGDAEGRSQGPGAVEEMQPDKPSGRFSPDGDFMAWGLSGAIAGGSADAGTRTPADVVEVERTTSWRLKWNIKILEGEIIDGNKVKETWYNNRKERETPDGGTP